MTPGYANIFASYIKNLFLDGLMEIYLIFKATSGINFAGLMPFFFQLKTRALFVVLRNPSVTSPRALSNYKLSNSQYSDLSGEQICHCIPSRVK